MQTWDYSLPANWQPQTPPEWEWYLVRKIDYNDLTGVKKQDLLRYFPLIQKHLDPGKRRLLAYFLKGQ